MRQLFLFITLCAINSLYAGSVPKSEAYRKAMQFVSSLTGVDKSVEDADFSQRRTSPLSQSEPFYIFNVEGGGFVVVSGDDRTEEILGYSTTATISEANMPDHLRAFLQSYADGIQYLNDHHVQISHTQKALRRSAMRERIEPLLSTTWDQVLPFNKQCPLINGQNSFTGCVATAMAQVMNYHKWPEVTKSDIPAYTTSNYHIGLEGVQAGTAIDWDNMQNSYAYNYYQGGNADVAVSTLMMLCGRSIQMDYGLNSDGGSSAFSELLPSALINYFDYEESTVRIVFRKDYTYSQWQDIIYSELSAKRPVLYSGISKGGGHAFVCDGYAEEDFFHINWGWSGMSDTYFRLCLLDPQNQGAGGSTTSDGYGMMQDAVIGIQRNDGVGTYQPHLFTSLFRTASDKTYTRSSANAKFSSIPIEFTFFNYTGAERTFNLGYFVLNQNGEMVEMVQEPAFQRVNIKSRYSINSKSQISLGTNLGDGLYRLVPASCVSSGQSLIANDGVDVHYIDFRISGNQLTILYTVQSPQLSVEATRVSGDKEAFAPLMITYSLKNNGVDAHCDLSFGIGKGSPTARFNQSYCGFLELESGKTTEFTTTFTIEEVGVYYLHLLTDEGIEIGSPVKVEIKESTAPRLVVTDISYDPELIDLNGNHYVEGKSMKAVLTIQNEGGKAYNNQIMIQHLVRIDGTWYYTDRDVYEVINVDIPSGETCQFETTISNVSNASNAEFYRIDFYYWLNDRRNLMYSTPEFEIRDEDAVKLQVSEKVDNPGNIENSFIGEEFAVEFEIKNMGQKAFNRKVCGTISTYNEGVWTNYGLTSQNIKSVSLKPNESTKLKWGFNIFNYPAEKYRILLFYDLQDGNGYWSSFYQSNEYQMDGSAITTVSFDTQRAKVFDMKGHQVGTSDQMNTLKPGVYIVNGKKMVKP